MHSEKTTPKRPSPTDWARKNFKGILDPLAGFLVRIGLHPNTMTLLGLAGNIAGAVLLARGQMTLGGVFILISGPFDALDGAMARLLGQPTKFGAFVDSVTDRWSELFIFLGLLYYYLQRNEFWMCILIFLATMGSVMVSYTKSRAETLGFDGSIGLLSRMERYLVMAPALLLNLPWLGVGIIAVFANITALQRAFYVRGQARLPGGGAKYK